LHKLHNAIAELGLNGAELILDVDTVLAAQGEQVFALHAQLARQGEDTNFLVSQAELPVYSPFRPINASARRVQPHYLF
jgi:hypothetical protein